LVSICMSSRVPLDVSADFQLTHEPMDSFGLDLLVLPVKLLRYRRIEPDTVSAFRMKGVRRPRKTSVWMSVSDRGSNQRPPESKSEFCCSYQLVHIQGYRPGSVMNNTG
jgi:hypothetical protein